MFLLIRCDCDTQYFRLRFIEDEEKKLKEIIFRPPIIFLVVLYRDGAIIQNGTQMC